MKHRSLVYLLVFLMLLLQFAIAVWPTRSLADNSSACDTLGGCDGRYESVNKNYGLFIHTAQLSYRDVPAVCVDDAVGVEPNCVYGYKSDGRDLIFEQESSLNPSISGIFTHTLITISIIGSGIFYAHSRH